MDENIAFGQCGKISPSEINHLWEKVSVPLGQKSYDILIGPGILLDAPLHISRLGKFSSLFIITDTNVEDFVGQDLLNILSSDQRIPKIELISFPAVEESKNMSTVVNLARQMLEMGADRSSLIIAVGGGVVGDIAGFLASIYMRGISFVQVPTTLLAQVDSSVGGKTGVDLPEGKNLLGTFAQPLLVLSDIGVLTTLPAGEIRNGISEIIKYGMIKDEELFKTLEKAWWDVINLEPTLTSFLVRRSCEIKAEVVAKDEKEGGYRRILNFGHTIGHAVEAASDYTIPHGEAVAMGMVAVSRLSAKRGLLSQNELERLMGLLEKFNLPTAVPSKIKDEDILKNIKKDKKAKAGKVFFVLANGIGDTLITDDVTDDEILEAIVR